MIKVENIQIMNVPGAIRGARNPLDSWDKSDSHIDDDGMYLVGQNDLNLMRRLYKAGTSHRKYLRQIFVCMDITAPLYWWKEMDQYKVGTVTNSCSTMHTLSKTPITADCFSMDDVEPEVVRDIVKRCEEYRLRFQETKNPAIWKALIQILPESWNQKRTLTMNYENAVSMIEQRSSHKLSEWLDFCDVLRAMPLIKEITADDMEGK